MTTTILLLAANPQDTPELKLYQEIYEINESVREAKYGAQFKFIPRTAVKRRDLLEAIDKHNPDIIHFSGHGDSDSPIYVIDESGKSEPIPQETIRDMFHHNKSVKCIIFNTCYLAEQAGVVAREINGVVIGVKDGLTDQEAIKFSREFYRKLANGKAVSEAYDAAEFQVKDGKKRLVMHNPTVAANKIKFVKRIPFIVELLIIFLLVLLVPLLSINSFISIFYSFSQVIAAERETTIIHYVAFIAGILGLISGMTWNLYLRHYLLSFLRK